MPDITLGNTPEWYGGGQGILKEQAEEARKLRTLGYEPFPGERIAPFSPLQQLSFNLAEQEADNRYYPQLYGQARGSIENALGQNVSERLAPYLQSGTANPLQYIDQYMNPYQQQVIENIGRLGSRNLIENILPNVQNRFISAGQYGSTGHQDLTNRAIRDTQEAITQAQGNALQGGFNTALQTAIGQQERQLQAGQLAGTTAGKDIERQMLGGEALQNLAGNQQQYALRNIGVLGQLGGQQQQQEQNAANIAYQNFLAQKRHPYEQLQFESEISRGLPVGSQVYRSNIQPTPPNIPQASPYSQAGGLVAGLTGAFNQRPPGYSHGGEVKKIKHLRHYAEGGALSPIQQGANDALDTTEIRAMRGQAQNLERPNIDPFWSSIARAGFNLAANRQPGVLSKLGEAAGAGLNEYQSQLAQQDQRSLQSAKIMNMIDTTRRLQAERNRSHELEKEKFGQHKKEFGMQHAIHQGQLGLAKEKFEHEKDLYEKGLKGSKNLKQNDIYKKSNEKAIERIIKSSESLPALKSSLNELKKVSVNLDTGPYMSMLPSTTHDIPLIGKHIAVGKPEDIDSFTSLTNQIALDLAEQMKSANISLGTRKIIGETKPALTRSKEGNLKIIDHMEDAANLIEEKNNFMTDILNSGGNAIDAQKAFNKYANAKLDAKNNGEEFDKTPEDFLGKEKDITSIDSPIDEKDISSISDEILMKIGGIK